MKLYLGSRDLCPTGFKSVDLDASYNPDIVADVCDLHMIEDESCAEIYASSILEHISWPQGWSALAEWTRVLRIGGKIRIAVPDTIMLCELILRSNSVWQPLGMMYGLGRNTNPLEAHVYGYTRETLTSLLELLGFSNFDSWESDLSDGANGWFLLDSGERVAVCLNLIAEKTSQPLVNPTEMLTLLNLHPDQNPTGLAQSLDLATPVNASSTGVQIQSMMFRLIDARQRIKYLEDQLSQQSVSATRVEKRKRGNLSMRAHRAIRIVINRQNSRSEINKT